MYGVLYELVHALVFNSRNRYDRDTEYLLHLLHVGAQHHGDGAGTLDYLEQGIAVQRVAQYGHEVRHRHPVEAHPLGVGDVKHVLLERRLVDGHARQGLPEAAEEGAERRDRKPLAARRPKPGEQLRLTLRKHHVEDIAGGRERCDGLGVALRDEGRKVLLRSLQLPGVPAFEIK